MVRKLALFLRDLDQRSGATFDAFNRLGAVESRRECRQRRPLVFHLIERTWMPSAQRFGGTVILAAKEPEPSRGKIEARLVNRASRSAGYVSRGSAPAHRTGRGRTRAPRPANRSTVNMKLSRRNVLRKKPGRPSTGQDPVTAIRLSPDLRAAIDEWRRHEPDLPARSEAIRRLVVIGLKKQRHGRV
jgi:hypothetical protein